MQESDMLLNVEDLRVLFPTKRGDNIAVDRVGFSVKKGEIFGIVGESGCGKSMTALSVLRLIAPPGKIVSGKIELDGEDLMQLSEKEMQRTVRGRRISMIFQEPMTSLNPLLTVGEQIGESLALQGKKSKQELHGETIELLKLAGIPLPEKRVYAYPHELSGGMRQRVMIAMAMACKPQLMIADEPTTALDVTIQAQILDLMKSLRDQTGTAIVLITHDLGVVANMCDRVAVMYCGSIVEEGRTMDVLKNPQHPYTQGLIRSIPRLHSGEERLYNIPGTVPRMINAPQCCHFADRCPYCTDRCRRETPSGTALDGGHTVRCFRCEVK